MIKINLASRKQSTTVAGSGGGGAGGFKVSKLTAVDLEAFRDLPIRKLALMAVVAIGASYLVDDYKATETKKVEDEYAKLDQERGRLQGEIAKTKGFEAMKKALEADERMIKTKIETIRKLLQDRQNPPKMLASLSSSLPSDVWLNSFAVASGKAKFMGFSTNYNQISDFMKNVNDSAYFTGLGLVNTQQTKDETGADAASFELSAEMRN